MKPSLILLLIFLAAGAAIPPKPAYQSLVLTHVTVIDMTSGQLKPDQTVEIEGNRIVRLSKSSEVWMASHSEIVDATGKFLIPGPPELEEQEFRFLTDGMDTHDCKKAEGLYQRFVKNETYHCPTLIIHRAWGSLSNLNFFRDPNLRYVPSKQRQSVYTT